MADEEKSSTELAQERTEKADKRTELAQLRSQLANERTFAGWVRTSFAAIGLGLGFHAVFGKIDPAWLPKVISTVFIGLGIFLIWKASLRAAEVMNTEKADEEIVGPDSFKILAISISGAAIALLFALWFLI